MIEPFAPIAQVSRDTELLKEFEALKLQNALASARYEELQSSYDKLLLSVGSGYGSGRSPSGNPTYENGGDNDESVSDSQTLHGADENDLTAFQPSHDHIQQNLVGPFQQMGAIVDQAPYARIPSNISRHVGFEDGAAEAHPNTKPNKTTSDSELSNTNVPSPGSEDCPIVPPLHDFGLSPPGSDPVVPNSRLTDGDLNLCVQRVKDILSCIENIQTSLRKKSRDSLSREETMKLRYTAQHCWSAVLHVLYKVEASGGMGIQEPRPRHFCGHSFKGDTERFPASCNVVAGRGGRWRGGRGRGRWRSRGKGKGRAGIEAELRVDASSHPNKPIRRMGIPDSTIQRQISHEAHPEVRSLRTVARRPPANIEQDFEESEDEIEEGEEGEEDEGFRGEVEGDELIEFLHLEENEELKPPPQAMKMKMLGSSRAATDLDDLERMLREWTTVYDE